MTLPRPENWHGPGVGQVVMAVGCGLFAVVSGIVGGVSLLLGDTSALPAVFVAVFFGSTALFAVPPQTAAAPHQSPEGLVLPYSRLLPAVFVAGVVGLVGGFVLLPDESPRVRVAVAAGTVVLAAITWHRARGRYAVVLAPDEVRIVRPRGSESAAWSRDVETYDVIDGMRVNLYRPHAEVGGLRVPVWLLAVGPVVAYWTLRYYAAHPQARAELVDGRAVDRVVRRELVDVTEASR